jgi:hypothetical protein
MLVIIVTLGLVILASIFIFVVAWPAMRSDYKSGKRSAPTLAAIACVALVVLVAMLGMTA